MICLENATPLCNQARSRVSRVFGSLDFLGRPTKESFHESNLILQEEQQQCSRHLSTYLKRMLSPLLETSLNAHVQEFLAQHSRLILFVRQAAYEVQIAHLAREASMLTLLFENLEESA